MLHTMIVVTHGARKASDWARFRRDSAEADAIVSLVTIDGDVATIVVPPTLARRAPHRADVRLPRTAPSRAGWAPLVDLLAQAEASIEGITSTQIVVRGHADHTMLRQLMGHTGGRVMVVGESTPAGESAAGEAMIRLIKVAAHAVTVVDTPLAGGPGIEYDPWNPADSWPATLTWLDDRELRIDVGPYALEAYVGPEERSFVAQGRETGPEGVAEFRVFGVTTERGDFLQASRHDALMVSQPVHEMIISGPKSPLVRGRLLESSTVFRGRIPDRAGTGDGTVDEVMRFQSVFGDKTVAARILTYPTPAKPLGQLRFRLGSLDANGMFHEHGSDHLYFDAGLKGFGGGHSRWFLLRPAPTGSEVTRC